MRPRSKSVCHPSSGYYRQAHLWTAKRKAFLSADLSPEQSWRVDDRAKTRSRHVGGIGLHDLCRYRLYRSFSSLFRSAVVPSWCALSALSAPTACIHFLIAWVAATYRQTIGVQPHPAAVVPYRNLSNAFSLMVQLRGICYRSSTIPETVTKLPLTIPVSTGYINQDRSQNSRFCVIVQAENVSSVFCKWIKCWGKRPSAQPSSAQHGAKRSAQHGAKRPVLQNHDDFSSDKEIDAADIKSMIMNTLGCYQWRPTKWAVDSGSCQLRSLKWVVDNGTC